MKRHCGLLILLCYFSIALQAQKKSGKLGIHVEAGYAMDLFANKVPDYHHHAFNIAVSPGYHFTENLFAGAGMALYDYRYFQKYETKYSSDIKINSTFKSVPLYAHGMWRFKTDSRLTLFLSLKMGYGFISKSMNPMEGNPGSSKIIRDYSGGLYLSPSIGWIYPINKKHAITLTASYEHQGYTITSKVNEKDLGDDKTNLTIAVKAGWFF